MSVFAVEMLFDQPPAFDRAALVADLRRQWPGIGVPEGQEREAGLHMFHHDHEARFEDGKTLPAQTVLMLADEPPCPDAYASALGQCWTFPGAEDAVRRIRHSALLTDLMAAALEPRERLHVVQRVLRVVLDHVEPVLLHWKTSDKLVDPAEFRQVLDEDPGNALVGAVNLRMFRVEDSTGPGTEIVMDTLGLAIFGLPDVQCHFQDLSPNAVAAHLYNLAAYLFEHGDVIESGHTVQGLEVDQVWRCQHEDALLDPPRVVLDVCPHTPHAAGRS